MIPRLPFKAMFTYPVYDVEIVREIDPGSLGWPQPGEAQDETGLGSNRSYVDLRRMTWAEARAIVKRESSGKGPGKLRERITISRWKMR